MIRDAIMDNNFLKNLDTTQVREIVDCVYERKVKTGQFVIKEGESGQHFYVAAGLLCSPLIDTSSSIHRETQQRHQTSTVSLPKRYRKRSPLPKLWHYGDRNLCITIVRITCHIIK